MNFQINQEIIEFKRGRDKKKRKRRRGKIVSGAKMKQIQNRKKAAIGAAAGLTALGIASQTPQGKQALQKAGAAGRAGFANAKEVAGTAKKNYLLNRRTGGRVGSAINAIKQTSKIRRKK